MTKTEQVQRLYRIIGETDDRYFEEAYAPNDTRAVKLEKRNRRIIFMYAAAAAAICIIAGSAGRYILNISRTGQAGSTHTMDVTDAAANQEPDDSGVAIGSPIREVSSLQEAEKITGFTMSIPETEAPYTKVSVLVISGDLISVSYLTQDESDEGYMFRKAAGTDDISGDYNVYANVKTVSVDGNDVTLKGNGETVSVAVWTDGTYSYAVSAADHPVSEEKMIQIAAAVK